MKVSQKGLHSFLLTHGDVLCGPSRKHSHQRHPVTPAAVQLGGSTAVPTRRDRVTVTWPGSAELGQLGSRRSCRDKAAPHPGRGRHCCPDPTTSLPAGEGVGVSERRWKSEVSPGKGSLRAPGAGLLRSWARVPPQPGASAWPPGQLLW